MSTPRDADWDQFWGPAPGRVEVLHARFWHWRRRTLRKIFRANPPEAPPADY